MKKIKERFEPNDILTLSSGFLARYAGSNKYDVIERFQNNLFIWVRDEVENGRKFNSHIEALEAFTAERDEYRRTHNTYEIEVFESVKIAQEDHDLILEKGDKIRILERDVSTYKAPKGKSWDAVVKELERQGAKSGKDYDLIGSENFWVSYKFDSPELQKILKNIPEAKSSISEGAIPQEDLVRAWVTDEKSYKQSMPRLSQAPKHFGLDIRDMVGWFANKYNQLGWHLFKASDLDKREFGTDVFRAYSEFTNTTNIIKFNLLTGKYAFVDDEAYEQDILKFEPMVSYDRLIIYPIPLAFQEFNIV